MPSSIFHSHKHSLDKITNIKFDPSSIATPSGATLNQPLAALSSVRASVTNITNGLKAQLPTPPDLNKAAASLMQSNGELIANAKTKLNLLPPGIASIPSAASLPSDVRSPFGG